MTDKYRRMIALLFLLCWLPQVSNLFPLPKIEVAKELSSTALNNSSSLGWAFDKGILDKTQYEANVIYNKMWKIWFKSLLMVLLGLISGILMFFNLFKWKMFVVLSSLLYMYNWHLLGTTSCISFIKAYQLKVATANMTGSYITFYYKDVFLPITFVSIIVYIVCNQIYSYKKRRKMQDEK